MKTRKKEIKNPGKQKQTRANASKITNSQINNQHINKRPMNSANFCCKQEILGTFSLNFLVTQSPIGHR
jgi:hypothetical protein